MTENSTMLKRSERMIILLYLIVILGWALLILIIKCRKAREKRIALARREAAQTQNAIHVIQIGNTVFDLIPITNASSSSLSSSSSRCQHHSHCRRAYRIRQSSSSNLSLNSSHENAHSNPTFVLDEGVFPAAPPTTGNHEAPPSYDEVIRLPNQYPKVQTTPSTESFDPPPAIEDIEINPSITTITSNSPAVFSNQLNRNQSNSNNHRHEPVT